MLLINGHVAKKEDRRLCGGSENIPERFGGGMGLQESTLFWLELTAPGTVGAVGGCLAHVADAQPSGLCKRSRGRPGAHSEALARLLVPLLLVHGLLRRLLHLHHRWRRMVVGLPIQVGLPWPACCLPSRGGHSGSG